MDDVWTHHNHGSTGGWKNPSNKGIPQNHKFRAVLPAPQHTPPDKTWMYIFGAYKYNMQNGAKTGCSKNVNTT